MRKKHDRSMLPYLLPCLAFILVFSGLVAWAVSYSHRFKVFKSELQECVLYCREGGSLQARVTDQRGSVDWKTAEAVQLALTEAGMGKRYKGTLPETEEGICLTFGNGASLSLTKTTLKLSDGESAPGVLVVFRSTDGTVYAYDTDAISWGNVYYAVLNALRRPA